MLVLGRGCAIPALLSARAGAEEVTCIEGSRMVHHMSKQILQENRDARNAAGIHLMNRPLHAIRLEGAVAEASSQVQGELVRGLLGLSR